jgi:hypothetical protein
MKQLKQYRFFDTPTQTISLKLSEKILERLKKEISKKENKNMSLWIECFVNDYTNTHIFNVVLPGKRKYKDEIFIKKTFTFSRDFVIKLKNSKNMSFYVESILTKFFALK